MKKGLLDTNFYVAFKRNDQHVVEIIRSLDFIGVDITVLAELYSGFKMGSKENLNISELEKFLNNDRTHIIIHDINTAVFYAHIIKFLKEKGTPIPTNDVWIAASAMQHGLTLYTLDKHFDSIEGLLK
jgi:tRNA(fMet)-specific endonuclease VapC